MVTHTLDYPENFVIELHEHIHIDKFLFLLIACMESCGFLKIVLLKSAKPPGEHFFGALTLLELHEVCILSCETH